MILFITTGSWGEISPTLAVALQLQEQGIECALACGPEWAWRAAKYGIAVHSIGDRMQFGSYSAHEFLRQIKCDELPACEAMVASFFMTPAHRIAKCRGIPLAITTTSAHWFTSDNILPAGISADFDFSHAKALLGLYPSFLNDGPIECVGYPRLPRIERYEPSGDYVLASFGTVIPGWHDDAKAWAACRGLECVNAGQPWIADHYGAMQSATAAIIHGGLGTLCDAVECKTPLIVRPFAYEQQYNAQKLIERGASLWPGEPGVADAEIESSIAAEAIKALLC